MAGGDVDLGKLDGIVLSFGSKVCWVISLGWSSWWEVFVGAKLRGLTGPESEHKGLDPMMPQPYVVGTAFT